MRLKYRRVPGNWDRDTRRSTLEAVYSKDRFPVCKLHGVKIMTDFPSGCPYRHQNPAERLAEYQNLGWRQLADDRGHAGLTLLDVMKTCNRCISEIGNNAHVIYLRRHRRLKRGA